MEKMVESTLQLEAITGVSYIDTSVTESDAPGLFSTL